jgi:glycosyltransferase involved in cell wall biosynthesis
MGGPVPETPESLRSGFTRAGNLAMQGIAEGLLHAGVDLTCFAQQPIQVFPRSKRLCSWPKRIEFPSGLVVHLVPSINLLFIRELCRGLYVMFAIVLWAFRRPREQRAILSYNTYNPPFIFLRVGARITRTPIVPVVFDIGLPPWSMGRLRDYVSRHMEKRMYGYLQKSEGRCVIVENILKKYAPGHHALLLDGGASSEILGRLSELQPRSETPGDDVLFVSAGLLNPHNGTHVIVEMMKINMNPRLRVVIAGSGSEQQLVIEYAKSDSRLRYVGMLDLDQLFVHYHAADVLLNIRLTKTLDTSTTFPSKFLESLAVGRLVVSTCVGHVESVYGKYCMLLRDETPEALSAMVDAVIAMPREERDAIGRSAREFMLREHTWDHQMKRVVRYCEGICAGEYENVQGLVDL